MPEVKCSVSNCTYWEQGNQCVASAIDIDIDKHAGQQFNEEFANETFTENHQDTASNISSTCCHTFELKQAK